MRSSRNRCYSKKPFRDAKYWSSCHLLTDTSPSIRDRFLLANHRVVSMKITYLSLPSYTKMLKHVCQGWPESYSPKNAKYTPMGICKLYLFHGNRWEAGELWRHVMVAKFINRHVFYTPHAQSTFESRVETTYQFDWFKSYRQFSCFCILRFI